MSKPRTVFAAAAVVAAATIAAGHASAVTVDLTPIPDETITGGGLYLPSEAVDFDFTVANGYKAELTEGVLGIFVKRHSPIETGFTKTLSDISAGVYNDFGGFSYAHGYIGLGLYGYSLTETALPEPASWAMMILGLGGLGAVLRRRRGPLAA